MNVLSTPQLESFNFQWETIEKPSFSTLKTINISLMYR